MELYRVLNLAVTAAALGFVVWVLGIAVDLMEEAVRALELIGR